MVTILILIDGFLQYKYGAENFSFEIVTILILIDGFLQYNLPWFKIGGDSSHNPYFNRWFSAIKLSQTNYKVSLESQSLF